MMSDDEPVAGTSGDDETKEGRLQQQQHDEASEASTDHQRVETDEDLKHRRLTQTAMTGERFYNPWSSWKGLPGLRDVWRFTFTSKKRDLPKDKSILDDTLPVFEPDWETFRSASVSLIWFGHASVLVNVDGFIVMTDPVFSDNCGPSIGQRCGLGPKRYRPVPCSVEELPEINCVVISHNHYDHLDTPTIRDLHRRFGVDMHWFVPSGLALWFYKTLTPPCNIHEHTWWQAAALEGATITCVPAQHWSTRVVFDKYRSLWSGWVISSSKHNFYFAGDTGYCPAFVEIGEFFEKIHAAAIPIGAYSPRYFMRSQHVDPEHAVLIHQEVRSARSIGVHWGTYDMGSKEHYLEPRVLLKKAAAELGLEEEEFTAPDHGEVIVAVP